MTGNQPGILPELIIVASVVVTVFGAALLTGQDQASWRTPAPALTSATMSGRLAPQTPTPTRPNGTKTGATQPNPSTAGSRRPVTPTPTSTPIPSPTPGPTTVG